MRPLNDCGEYGILDAWIHAQTWREVAVAMQDFGYAATPDTSRRRVQYVLRKNGWLKPGEVPTPKTYSRIKASIREQWSNQDIL